jgi:hypothetical protein
MEAHNTDTQIHTNAFRRNKIEQDNQESWSDFSESLTPLKRSCETQTKIYTPTTHSKQGTLGAHQRPLTGDVIVLLK